MKEFREQAEKMEHEMKEASAEMKKKYNMDKAFPIFKLD